jgi:hypothetical protein
LPFCRWSRKQPAENRANSARAVASERLHAAIH